MEQSGTAPANGERATAHNRLLAVLPEEDRMLIEAQAERLDLQRDAVLFHPGEEAGFVYFPCDAMVSLIVVTRSGESAETGLIGSEGAVSGLIGASRTPAFARGVVQIPGHVLKVDMEAVERAKTRSPRVTDLLARGADCLLAQLLQTIACNALHSLERRLPSRLLSVQLRLGMEELPLTQEHLAEMLGVQRTTVTAIASAFQQRGWIEYARGRIRILDIQALESASCGCHASVKRHYDRLLPGAYSPTASPNG